MGIQLHVILFFINRASDSLANSSAPKILSSFLPFQRFFITESELPFWSLKNESFIGLCPEKQNCYLNLSDWK